MSHIQDILAEMRRRARYSRDALLVSCLSLCVSTAALVVALTR